MSGLILETNHYISWDLIYFDIKSYTKSRARFEQLLNEYPRSEFTGSSLYWIGESFVKQNRTDEAIQYLTEAVNARKGNKFIDYAVFTLATLYEKKGDYKNAVKYYDQLLSYYKDSPLALQAQIRIGISYFKLKDYQSSILELNNPMLNDLPKDLYAESIYLLANSYYRAQDYNNAEKSYSEIIKKFPDSDVLRDAQYGLAWTYFQQKDYNKAYLIFNSLSVGSDSLAEKSFYWKAEAKRYLGENSNAYNIYQDFLRKYPNSELASGVQYQIGTLYYNDKKLNQSLRFLDYAKNTSNENIKAKSFILQAEINLENKKYIKAKSNYESVINIEDATNDERSAALLGLGTTLFYLKDYKGALAYLSNLDSLNPDFEADKRYFYTAENNFALNNYSEALNDYKKINAHDNEIIASANYGKAYCYFETKDYPNAILQFNDFIKNYPDDSRTVDARLRLADSYYGNKNFAAASRVYRDIFNLDKNVLDDPYTYYQYAQALYKAGSINEALNEFRNLQQKFPQSSYADKSLFTVGWIYFQQNNFEEAIENYRNVLKTYPNSAIAPVVFYSIGDSYFNMGRYDSAIVNYQKVIVQFPKSHYVFDAVNGIQYSYVAQGKTNKAINLIDQFTSQNPGLSFSDQIFFKKGEIYYSNRDYEKAKMSYKEFVADYPNSSLVPDAYYWIGKCAQNLNEDQEAVYNFNRVFQDYPKSESAAAAVIEMGNIYNNKKDYDSAIKILDAAIDKLSDSPRMPEILFMKGVTLTNKSELNDAYDVFQQVVQYYGNSIFAAKAKIEIGLIQIAAGLYEKAQAYFSELAQSRSDDIGAKAQYYLGLSLFQQEQYQAAIDSLDRVRTIFSNYDEWLTKAYLLMGDSYVKLKEPQKAKEYYRAVIKKHRDDDYGKEAKEKLKELK